MSLLKFFSTAPLVLVFSFYLIGCADSPEEEVADPENVEATETPETEEVEEEVEMVAESPAEEGPLNTSSWLPAFEVGEVLIFRFTHSFGDNEELAERYGEPYLVRQTVERWENVNDEEFLLVMRSEEDGPDGFLEAHSRFLINAEGMFLIEEGLVDGGGAFYVPGSLLLPGELPETESVFHQTEIIEQIDGQEVMLEDSRELRFAGREDIEIGAGVFADCLRIEGQVETVSGDRVQTFSFTEWFAPGLGLVKGEWTTEGEKFAFELESFSIE
ncbi:MAG: hypothetical protein LAT55_11525 [Opitutales bacterium]|nr:hypothetical protein [Opitutales bacterium]